MEETNNRGGIVLYSMDLLTSQDKVSLSEGSRRICDTPNAGGSSIWSEVLAFEVLSSLFPCSLMKTEMELKYWPPGCKITDFSIQLFNQTVGVSVTRAMKFRGQFSEEDALHLFAKKLEGVNVSSLCVLPEQAWRKQILFIWASHQYVADTLMRVYSKLEDTLRSNTLVAIFVSNNANWIY